jgi:hypothetical protein
VDAATIRNGSVLVALAHWWGESGESRRAKGDDAGVDRFRLLTESIDAVLALEVDRVVVAVVTNAPDSTARALASHFAARSVAVPVEMLPGARAFTGPFPNQRSVFSIGWRPSLLRRHGFYLTWAHKAVFRQVLSDPSFSLMIYLEDDIRFTDQSLSYWCRFREPLFAHGLLPGYVRYEKLGKADYVVDQQTRQDLARPSIRIRTADSPVADLLFVGLTSPYQGMFVLDRPLAMEHLRYSPARDPFRSEHFQDWRLRERAAMGPIFDDVPSGFEARNVVPVRMSEAGRYELDASCLIEHTSGTNTRHPKKKRTLFGTIRVDELFVDSTPAGGGANNGP